MLVLAAVAVLASCGSTGGMLPASSPSGVPNASPTPGVHPSASAAASPSTGSATPPVCRIPIASYGGVGTTGFVTYPGGDFVPDGSPESAIPPGYAPAGWTYDRLYAKWLPVPPDWVTADGKRYAYGSSAGGMGPQPKEPGLHVVDVASDSDKRVAGGDWRVVGFTAKGVYAMAAPVGSLPSGLWLVNPDSGGLQKITQVGTWTHVTNGWAWGVEAGAPGVILARDHLLRLDLASGSVHETWFARPGMDLYALGDDGDSNVIVQATGGPSDALEFWVVGEQTPTATRIYLGGASGQFSLVPVALHVLGDRHGVWFGTFGGLYLYRPGAPLSKVAVNAGQVAGACA